METNENEPEHSRSSWPRNILFVYEKFPPFTLSGSWRSFFFVKHLPEFGYIPHVISCEPEPKDPIDNTLLEQLDPRCQTTRRRLCVTTPRQWLSKKFGRNRRPPGADAIATDGAPNDAPPPQPSREKDGTLLFKIYWAIVWRLYWYVDWALPVVTAGLSASLRKRHHLVYVSGPHSRNFFAGYWLAVLLRRPLILDIRDPWTYGSLWGPRTADVARAERKWARRILRRADRIIFTSPLTQREMQWKFPDVRPDRMCTITNGFNDEPAEPLRDAPDNVCLFRYTGTLNERRTPDILLDALQKLRETRPAIANEIRLEFAGGMAGHESRIAELDLSDIVINRGRVPHDDSLRLIRGADVNILLQTITDGQDVISGKAFEYLAARRPILAVVSESGGDAWFVRETGVGIVAPFDNPAAVAAAIEECWQHWKTGADMATFNQASIEKYARRNLTRELASVFDEVLDSRPR